MNQQNKDELKKLCKSFAGCCNGVDGNSVAKKLFQFILDLPVEEWPEGLQITATFTQTRISGMAFPLDLVAYKNPAPDASPSSMPTPKCYVDGLEYGTKKYPLRHMISDAVEKQLAEQCSPVNSALKKVADEILKNAVKRIEPQSRYCGAKRPNDDEQQIKHFENNPHICGRLSGHEGQHECVECSMKWGSATLERIQAATV